MPDSTTPSQPGVAERLVSHDAQVIQPVRERWAERISLAKASPVEAQIAFIKELVKSQEATKAFLNDPKQYAVDHGILISPEVVKAVTDSVIFDATLDEDLVKNLGPSALQDLVDMRQGKPTGVQANAAAVAAGAAVVMAVVAVVTMVVTLVRTQKPADLVSLQGLGENGILLPTGERFIPRDLQGSLVNPVRGIGGMR